MIDFVAQSLPQLQTLPVPLAALLMQQVLRHDLMFPREKRELEATLVSLRLPRSPELVHAVAAFQALRMPAGMNSLNWQKEPAAWVESFTAAMWSSGQIEAYRNAAKLALPLPMETPADMTPRAVVVAYDKRLQDNGASMALFRRLRSEGTLFRSVQNADNGLPLHAWMAARAKRNEEAYAHWWVSGDEAGATPVASAPIAYLTYAALQPARQHLLMMMNEARHSIGTGGPEGLRRAMQALTPDEMGLRTETDPVLRAFATDVLVGGSGTQLYSTTFVQWTAREVLRRAQPRTLVAKFTARNSSASMDTRLAHPLEEPPPDFAGSLVDAEMGAYLTYLNLLRLPGAEQAHFLAWHEGYGQAMLIGKGVPRGQIDTRSLQLSELLQRLT